MMTAIKTRPAFHTWKAGTITPLLRFLAGDHASEIAHLWPAPHEGFFALPSARRHATAILLERAHGHPDGISGIVSVVERGRDNHVASHIAGGGEVHGLMKALAKMGEMLWTGAEYEIFLTLFNTPSANRALRHLGALTPAAFAPIAALPDILREAAIIAAVPNLPAAVDLATAFDLALRMRGRGEAGNLAARWARAKDTKRLFEMAVESLTPDLFCPLKPAPNLGPAYARVETRKDLVATALAFENCLRDFTYEIAIGRMAIYVWQGEPKAVLGLIWDAAGWRLAEAEGKGNTELEEPVLRHIAAEICTSGVRLGPAVKILTYRLERRGSGDASVDPPGTSWVDRLELGDLWE